MVALALSLVSSLNVLVFTKTAGYRHDSISAGVEMVKELGKEAGWTVVQAEDSKEFTQEKLRRFAVVVFLNTTGDVLDRDQESAFEEWAKKGRGFLGIHSAADTEYEWAFYGQLIGAYFKSHPQIQPARIRIEDPKDPCCAHLPKIWERTDEWYCFRANPRKNVKVLGSLETRSYSGSTMGDDHPIMWKHEVGRARSFYTGMGHTKETYAEPLFREKIRRAIQWVGRVPSAK